MKNIYNKVYSSLAISMILGVEYFMLLPLNHKLAFQKNCNFVHLLSFVFFIYVFAYMYCAYVIICHSVVGGVVRRHLAEWVLLFYKMGSRDGPGSLDSVPLPADFSH